MNVHTRLKVPEKSSPVAATIGFVIGETGETSAQAEACYLAEHGPDSISKFSTFHTVTSVGPELRHDEIDPQLKPWK